MSGLFTLSEPPEDASREQWFEYRVMLLFAVTTNPRSTFQQGILSQLKQSYEDRWFSEEGRQMDEIKWAIVEVIGHAVYAGEFERRIGYLIVKVPDTPTTVLYEKQIGDGAMFRLTPCSKSVARRAAEVLGRPECDCSHTGLFPIWDPHCLNDVSDPMAEVDLEAAREKDVERLVARDKAHEEREGEPF